MAADTIKILDIVEELMLTTGFEDTNVNQMRYKMLMYAKQGLKEMQFDSLKLIRELEFVVNDAGKVLAPDDMIEYAGVYYVNSEGLLVQIMEKPKYSKSYRELLDSEGNKLTDEEGDVLLGRGSRRVPRSQAFIDYFISYLDYYPYGAYPLYSTFVPGLQGSELSFSGYYVYDRLYQEFLFDYLPQGVDSVVIRYVADLDMSKDVSELEIHKYFARALEEYIVWRVTERNTTLNQYDKQYARRQFYHEYKKARRRFNGKKEVWLENMRTARGYYKY